MLSKWYCGKYFDKDNQSQCSFYIYLDFMEYVDLNHTVKLEFPIL